MADTNEGNDVALRLRPDGRQRYDAIGPSSGRRVASAALIEPTGVVTGVIPGVVSGRAQLTVAHGQGSAPKERP